MDSSRGVVVLTGAGISAESGVPTFRANGGLWKSHRFEDLATPEAFYRDPQLVWAFYRWRQQGVIQAQPNAAHQILADMEQTLGRRFTLITQNVDDLHERGGSRSVLHMHGEIMKARCDTCGLVYGPLRYDEADRPCDHCSNKGRLRPHIVWFGEMPFHMPHIQATLQRAGLFMAIGTSGVVYPAAQFVHMAREGGAKTVLINLDPADNRTAFDQVHTGSATEVLKKLWLDNPRELFANYLA